MAKQYKSLSVKKATSTNKNLIKGRMTAFETQWDIYTGQFLNASLPALSKFIYDYGNQNKFIGWENKTNNLWDSIGLGVFRNGVIVQWSGGLHPKQAKKPEKRYGYGRDALIKVLLEARPLKKKAITYTIQVAIGLSYGIYLDNKYGWVDPFVADLRKEIDKMWLKYTTEGMKDFKVNWNRRFVANKFKSSRK